MGLSPKEKFAWSLAPYYKEALAEGSADIFFSEIFVCWFEHFPIPKETQGDADIVIQIEEAVCIVFRTFEFSCLTFCPQHIKKLVKRFRFYNCQPPKFHWT